MRAERALLFLAAILFAACAVDLDDGTSPPSVAPASSVEVLPACLPLRDHATTIEGRLGSVRLPDGRLLLVSSSATIEGETGGAGFYLEGSDPCAEGRTTPITRPLIDATVLGADVDARPLAVIAAAGGAYAFFSAERIDSTYGLVTLGRGVATWDPIAERFVNPSLLWTGDRPSFGGSAAVVDDTIFVYGSKPARFLSSDVYVARAPVARIAEIGAWEYYDGGGNWTESIDGAWPLVPAGEPVSVLHDPTGGWLMAYIEPLGDRVLLRHGLGPSGPWSAATAVGRCDLPPSDPGAFCGDVVLHEGAIEGHLLLSYGIGSFHRAADASPEQFWTRWTDVTLPAE
jgi:hypothetical protein